MTALSRTCSSATLWLWPGQAVYAGPSLDLGEHAGSVACLAVAVDAPMTVTAAGRPPFTCRSALIPARLPHQLVASGERMVFCYFDPASSRARACEAQMTSQAHGVLHTHRHENTLVRKDVTAAWPEAAAPLTLPARSDERIGPAARRLLERPDPESAATELAAEAGLSLSRFLHLFKEQTGTSFRRYRLWARMLRAAELLRDGHDLTRIAADSGFSSPSHLSSTFHAMFGLTPSRLLAVDLTVLQPDSTHP